MSDTWDNFEGPNERPDYPYKTKMSRRHNFIRNTNYNMGNAKPLQPKQNSRFTPSYLTRKSPKKSTVNKAIQHTKNHSRSTYLERLRNRREQTANRTRSKLRNVATASASAANANNFRLPPPRPNAISFVPPSESASIQPRPPRGGYTLRKQRKQRK